MITQIWMFAFQVREQDSTPENLNKIVPGLLTLKRAIEKVPGCEPPPPPTIDTEIITDFRSDIMQMVDRLTGQIKQMGNGEPPRETTHL